MFEKTSVSQHLKADRFSQEILALLADKLPHHLSSFGTLLHCPSALRFKETMTMHDSPFAVLSIPINTHPIGDGPLSLFDQAQSTRTHREVVEQFLPLRAMGAVSVLTNTDWRELETMAFLHRAELRDLVERLGDVKEAMAGLVSYLDTEGVPFPSDSSRTCLEATIQQADWKLKDLKRQVEALLKGFFSEDESCVEKVKLNDGSVPTIEVLDMETQNPVSMRCCQQLSAIGLRSLPHGTEMALPPPC